LFRFHPLSFRGERTVRLHFGGCLLDTELRQLTRQGGEIPLSPKAFRLLEVLAERRPRAVTLAELRRLVWPDMSVGGTTVARLVNEVRSALGDQERPPRIIRTVHRFGYAFCAEAREEPDHDGAGPSWCSVQWGERLIALRPGENLIGRAADAVVNVTLGKVSRRHARIVVYEDRAVLEDLGSRNGTLLAERKVEGAVPLADGDLIQVGPALLIFRASSAEATTF
jgi:DNA-binding winged helix-turn-helix (wHTH) protein